MNSSLIDSLAQTLRHKRNIDPFGWTLPSSTVLIVGSRYPQILVNTGKSILGISSIRIIRASGGRTSQISTRRTVRYRTRRIPAGTVPVSYQ